MTNKEGVEMAASQILADLREARGVLYAITDTQARERLDLLLARAELGIDELRRHLAGPPQPVETGAPTAEEFEPILKAVKERWPDRERVALIGDMATSARFTSAQVRALLGAFDWDDGRIEAIVMLYPKVVDGEAFFQALEAFVFSSKADEARRRLGLA